MSESTKRIEQIKRHLLIGLCKATAEENQMIFKRMYSHQNLDASIEEVVAKITPDKLDWATSQCERTLEKKMSAAELYDLITQLIKEGVE